LLTYHCRSSSGHNLFPWRDIKKALEKSDGDVLLILDSCHSAAATKTVMRGTKVKYPYVRIVSIVANGLQLLIAACPENAETNGPPDDDSESKYTFTRALINTLKGMTPETFSAIAIWAGITEQMDQLRPLAPHTQAKNMHNPILNTLVGRHSGQDIRLV
jgi:hypothetical protein